MSKLDELIQQLCPNGVEWVKLINISNIQYGYPFDSNLFSDDGEYIPLIRIRDVKPAHASTYYMGEYDSTYIIRKGDILVGMDGNFNLEKWNDKDGLLNQRVCKIYTKNDNTVINEYLYHLLKPLFKKIEEDIKGGTVKHLSAQIINKIEIPLPPLPIQEEIVRILDKFTQVAAELKAELKARKDEYDYYRNQLLSFDASHTDVEWKTLGEICNINRGVRVIKKDLLPVGEIPVYQNSLVCMGFYHTSNYPADITFVITAGAAGDIGYSNIPFWAADDCLCLCSNGDVLNKFIYHFLYIKQLSIKSQVRKGAIPRLSRKVIENLEIPIPPLAEQQRIVDILDRFEKLTNDMTEGIPAEIETTQQMYEYYRDKLLTFKKKEE